MASRNIYIDVSNTLAVTFTSGIQRVTRELIYHLLRLPSDKLCFIPITYCDICRAWYRLNKTQRELLTAPRPPSRRPIPVARSLKNKLRKGIENALGKDHYHRLTGWINRLGTRLGHPEDHRDRHSLEPEPGAVFLDMESSWHNSLRRSVLLPWFADNNVAIATLHHDIIPVLFPEWVHPGNIPLFNDHLRAHLEWSSLFICTSECVKRDLLRYCGDIHHDRRFNTARITLGSDYRIPDIIPRAWPLPAGKSRIILCVGTIEPRKNQELLLEAFDRIADRFPDALLVFAGRAGWQYDRIIRAIKESRLWKRQLFWLTDVDDGMLEKLYRNAYLSVVPSRYEGYGLPVAESLARKCVTLSSSAGGLPEAGREFADYFPPDNMSALQRLLEKYLGDPLAYERRRQALAEHHAHTWQASAGQLLQVMERFCDHLPSSRTR